MRVLLIIGGGIAAYKAPDLVRRLREKGWTVRCLLTAAAAQFVAPLALASLTGEQVYENLFDLTEEADMGHIQLSRDADIILVAPATADLLAKMAQGTANDLASTVLLATDKPVFVAPAMNVRMWHHAATQRNIARLADDGVAIIGPREGDMACGEYGLGRMAEPEEIAAELTGGRAAQSLSGKRVLVTAGPTHEPLDPIRYLANHSSGKQGYAIAEACAALGAQVQLVSGPSACKAGAGIALTRVTTAQEMLAACTAALPLDAAICTAAIADWRPAEAAAQKLKKSPKQDTLTLKLVKTPDILMSLARADRRPKLLIGFAAETEKLAENARAKLKNKGCDWIVANNVAEADIMGGDENCVRLIRKSGEEDWPRTSKRVIAERLAQEIAQTLAKNKARR